jgi:2-keto-3-deoxy-6-phosphogluconate aldolase
MPTVSNQLVVGTERVEIPVSSVMPWRIEIKNADNSDDLYIGNGEVTTSTGMRLAKLERISLAVGPNDKLYLVSAKEGHNAAYVAVTQAG